MNLTATEAAASLERYGGEVAIVGPTGLAGSAARYWNAGRQGDAIDIVLEVSANRLESADVAPGWASRESGGGRHLLVRDDEDRRKLTHDMELVREAAAAMDGISAEQVAFFHRPAWQSDGGYGQIGCLLAIVSAAVGAAISIAIGLVRGEGLLIGPTLIGFATGWPAAMSTADLVAEGAWMVPRLVLGPATP